MRKVRRYFYTYILTNYTNTVLYTGITNHLVRRLWQHKHGTFGGFTTKYKVHKLVYFETFDNPTQAIEREKQIKAGSRLTKLKLITAQNPSFKDLYEVISFQ